MMAGKTVINRVIFRNYLCKLIKELTDMPGEMG